MARLLTVVAITAATLSGLATVQVGLANRGMAEVLRQQETLLHQQEDLLGLIFGLGFGDVSTVRTLDVFVTCYSSERRQTDDTPHVTASLATVRPGVLAVSRDLLEEHGLRYGQRVLLGDYGLFVVADTMNERWRKRVDIWVADRTAAMLHGVQESTLIWVDE